MAVVTVLLAKFGRFWNSSGCVYFVAKIFVTSICRDNHFKSAFCLFGHAISTELRVTSFFALIGASSFAGLNLWSHVTCLTLKNVLITLEIDFSLFQRVEVKWVRVTLIECYLRAATRSSDNLSRFSIKIKDNKKKSFWPVSLSFWVCRSTNLLRLFSSNLPSMFLVIAKVCCSCKAVWGYIALILGTIQWIWIALRRCVFAARRVGVILKS